MIVRRAQPHDARRIAEIHVLSWQTAFSDFMPDDFLAKQSVDDRKDGWLHNMRDYPGNLIVVEDDLSNIVGFSCSGKANSPSRLPFDGEVFGIHVDPLMKGKGYGYQLMSASFEWLAKQNCKSACLWTLEQNIPARKFYERIGGTVVGQSMVNIGGRELSEIAYGWRVLNLNNLSDLIHPKP
jgi:ribosomal protein S18 acetylase RimI-like enzyme